MSISLPQLIDIADKASLSVREPEARQVLAMCVSHLRHLAAMTIGPGNVPIVLGRPAARRNVLCICGSTRFAKRMNAVAEKATLDGWIVVRPEVVEYSAERDIQKIAPEAKVMVDNLHLLKIDMASRVVVVNEGGYIGESTKREIEYARAQKKEIVFFENWAGIGSPLMTAPGS